MAPAMPTPPHPTARAPDTNSRNGRHTLIAWLAPLGVNLAAQALIGIAAKMRATLETKQPARMPAPTRVSELEAQMRALLGYVREQASVAGVDAGPDAARPPPPPSREVARESSAPSGPGAGDGDGGKGAGKGVGKGGGKGAGKGVVANDADGGGKGGKGAGKGGGKGGGAASDVGATASASQAGKGEPAPLSAAGGTGKGGRGKGEGGGGRGGRGAGGSVASAVREAAIPAAIPAPEEEEVVVLYKQTKETVLGITLTNERGAPVITGVAPPPALASGVLYVGDTITAVNEWTATGHSETTARLKRLRGKLRLKVVRGYES
jgi:hypothetical protein